MDVSIRAESVINPTEDEAKVERAMHNIFPSTRIERVQGANGLFLLRIQSHDLETLSTLRNLIRQERIRSAARSLLRARTRGERIHMFLNKQAAFAGHVSFCEPTGESPNGPISIEVESSEMEPVIDFLASNPNEDYLPTARRGR